MRQLAIVLRGKSASTYGNSGLSTFVVDFLPNGIHFGIVLASLIPEKSQVILAPVADYAYRREVCGNHYHSDIEASHALGNAIGIARLKNEIWKPQIEAAREELLAARLTKF